MSSTTIKKVTISLPEELLAFADSRAGDQRISRSGVISDLLERERLRQVEALAREGYERYAREAEEFAEATAKAIAESWGSDGPAR
jgi:metal-responsive CopG/Arc/MetJ family transcriptional regulator